jgi:hypothetical protein
LFADVAKRSRRLTARPLAPPILCQLPGALSCEVIGAEKTPFVAKITSFATFHLMRKISRFIVAYIVLQKRATPWTSDTPV